MSESDRPELRRSLGFWALAIYGVGDILGAGIYALVGEIAKVAADRAASSFLVALGVASLTALSYAELGSRFPRSGGEAHFCEQAFRSPALALLVGWLVLSSGIVSLATMSHAFAGYLVPEGFGGSIVRLAILAGFLLALGGVNFSGIRQSSAMNIVCTFVESSGLFIVLAVGLSFLSGAGEGGGAGGAPGAGVDEPTWIDVGRGGALAFFAFIGFEDMVNVAEEVERPERNLPAAILTALVFAGALYFVVIWVATSVVPPDRLAGSEAPLLQVVEVAAPWFPAALFTLIALFAVANTGLLNFVTGSRLVYGMSRQGLLPAALGVVHARTRTPHRAIGAVLAVTVALAFSGTLPLLAGTTSTLLLAVFLVIHLSLIRIKWRDRSPATAFRVPLVAPILGALSCIFLAAFVKPQSLLSAATIVGIGLVIVAVHRWRTGTPRGRR